MAHHVNALPGDLAARILPHVSPRERLEDVVALASHLAQRRAHLREDEMREEDLIVALAIWGWYATDHLNPCVQRTLERLRLELVFNAHYGVFEDADRLVPDCSLAYDVGVLDDLQGRVDGHWRYLDIQASPSLV